MTKKEKTCFIIANNALYFADNSDYRSAFFDIMRIVKPRITDKELDHLKYIEGEETK